ncbi:hypothetical protein GPJ56_005336 [Histomonas meleagridis]|uniref:uncharacterized protein n=1 Tax=Histomonas meleagridis TaxID=135588 RepID=UPI0035594052|nr:hypothetical protein GPJ56_005336 [Histomonas meleagridis]KAH0796316.1 hypothetical protein GO595_010209 [Histomonas meleagridis]
MNFTKENVLQAIEAASGQNPNDIQNALNYLQEWRESPQGIQVAVDILISSNNLNARLYSASLVNHQIQYVWHNVQTESKAQIRQGFYSLILSNAQFPPISSLLTEALSQIAILDFPDEFPEFESVIFPGNYEELEQVQCVTSTSLLGSFGNMVEESTQITTARKQSLRNYLLDKNQELSMAANFCFVSQDVSLNLNGLKIFNILLQLLPLNQVITLKPFLQKVCFEFVYKDELIDDSAKCLRTLFSKRIDSREMYPLVPLILFSFTSPNALLPSGLPISSKQQIINIIMLLLSQFFLMILPIFYTQQMEPSPTTQTILNTLNEEQISINDFYVNIMHIFEVIISLRKVEELSTEYWGMWTILLRTMISEKKISRGLLHNFIAPIIGHIRESLFEVIPNDLIDDFTCSARSKNVWNCLALYDFESMKQFLLEKTPSISLCYALGNLDDSLPIGFDFSIFNQLIFETFQQFSNETNPKCHVSLLYCLSHVKTISNPQIFNMFFEYALKCISETSGTILPAAVNALYYAFRKDIENKLGTTYQNLLENDCAKMLCQYSELYLKQLDFNDGVKMYVISITLTSYETDKDKVIELLKLLIDPLMEAISVTYQPEKTFEIITQCSMAAGSLSKKFFEHLWDPLLSALSIMLSSNPNVHYLEGALKAIAAGMTHEPLDLAKFEMICGWMSNHFTIQDCFFDFFAALRREFVDINRYLAQIVNTFVLPLANFERICFPSIFNMFSQFGFGFFDFECFLPLADRGLSSLFNDDVKAVCECLITLISKMDNMQAKETIYRTWGTFISRIFVSLTDTLHQNVINSLINLLRCFFLKANNLQILNDELLNGVLAALQNVVGQEQEQGMFMKFILYMKDVVISSSKFAKAVCTFLIIIRKLSPSDYDAFEIKIENKPFSFSGPFK